MSDPTLLAALRAAPSALLVVDGAGRVVALSDALAETLAGAAVGRTLADLGGVGAAAAALADRARQPGSEADLRAAVADGGRSLCLTARPLAPGDDAAVLLSVDGAPAAAPAHGDPAAGPVGHVTELLAAIVDSSDDAIVSKSLDGVITSWNGGAERLLGYTAAEAIGRSILMLIPPDRQDEEAHILGRIRSGQRVDHFETVRRTKGGRDLDVSITVSPVRAADGRVVGASKILRDITEAKRIEAALREEAATLEVQARTIETVGRVNALLAAELDPERLVQAVVDAGRELTGAAYAAFFYTPLDGREGDRSGMLYALSGAPREAFAGFPAIQPTPLFAPTFQDGEVVRSSDVLADSRYGRLAPNRGLPEGHLPVRSYLAVPVRSRGGDLVGALLFGHAEPGVFGDRAEQIAVGLADQAAIALQNARLYQELNDELGERERTEAALRESEARFRSMTDTAPMLVWMADTAKQCTYFNGSWLAFTGRPVEEELGDGWVEGVHPDDADRCLEVFATHFDRREPFEMEYRLRRHDGEYRWIVDRGVPRRSPEGEFLGFIGSCFEVHDRKQAETHARYLAQTGTLIEQALDTEATLQQIARLGVPGFADWCSISLRNDDGTISTVAIAHQDPEKVRWGWELQEIRPIDPDDPTGAANVIRTGQPELYPDIPDELLQATVKDEEELALLRSIGFSSVAIVPMRAGNDVIGAISFVNAESGRHFDEVDLAVAEEIGRRAGAALETARLYGALRQSEALAREAETRTRALFEATPDVVLVYPVGPDGPGPFIDVNEGAVETYGYTRDELLQRGVHDLIVPESLSVPDAIARLRAEGTARFESVHRARDGREIPMETVAHLVRRDGRDTVLSVCRDMTERREAEEALRQRERELHTLADSIPQLAWMADAGGAVSWFNQRWYDYTGTSPDRGADGDWGDVLHPDEADRVAAGYRAAFAAGEPWEDTFRIRGADGAYRWFLSRAVPLRHATGRVARWFGTNTDVTEQRRLLAERDEALDRLRHSQARHRLALEGGRMGTWEWDVRADRLDGDDRAHDLWQRRPDEIASVADFYARLVHPDDLAGLQAEVAAALADGHDYAAEFRIVRPDGHVRWLANRGRLVRDGAGAPVRMFGLSFDVTERREAEEALRMKNREMEQFTYTISHDLKSPLVTVTGFVGLLKGHLEAGRTAPALAAADRVLGAADRMARLIEDLLQLSRAGRVVADPAPVDLDALAAELADALGPRARSAGGTLEVRAPLGRLLTDSQRVGEVLENLLANAITYGLGGGGSRVTVHSEPSAEGGLCLIVEDDGPGVPAPYRDKVFGLFQRLDGGGSGTGIGLALVARVMEVVGGRAYVEGAGGPDGREGARFVLVFPPRAVLGNDPAATGVEGPRDLPTLSAPPLP